MNKNNRRARSVPREGSSHSHSPDEVRHLLRFEEHILQSISAGEPLADVLNRICSPLDCQIGNVVSVIAPSGDHACEFAAISAKAELFGLSIFCSEKILAENYVLLGTLDMYCINPRTPSAVHFPLIERGKCLAVLAIKLATSANRLPTPDPREGASSSGPSPQTKSAFLARFSVSRVPLLCCATAFNPSARCSAGNC